jgi:methionine-rich copper-binding protein CopC
MKRAILCCFAVLVLCAVSVRAHAQTKFSFTVTCAPTNVMQVVTGTPQKIGSQVSINSCTASGEIAGSAMGPLAFATYVEDTGTELKAWGPIVQTLASGDAVYFATQTTITLADGHPVTGQESFTIFGGTGKMASIKGSGVCAVLYGAPGTNAVATCTGEYSLP